MTEEKKHISRKFLFNPLKRPLPYLGLVMAFMLILFQQSIRNYVSDTIGNILVNSMKDATGGFYKTSYDLVRFDIISRKLKISNLKIELDTTVISKEEYLNTRPHLIHVNTPIIVVKLRSLLPLLFNKKLYISYVGAQNPAFTLIKSTHSSITNEDKENNRKDFAATINTYFEAFEIDSFRVEKGSFKISTHSSKGEELNLIHIGEFTTMLKNFRLDSLSPSILLKGISAQSLELEILNQEVNLPEINQNIHFNRLLLSTTDSTFVLDSLKIRNISTNKVKNQSDLFINKLEILGFNFEKAFSKNELLVHEIWIREPAIVFKKSNFDNKINNTSSQENSIFEYFNQLKVNKINLLGGSIDYEAERKSKIENFNISISDYEINPKDWKNRKAISNFKIELINATNIEHELPDSIHIAKVEQVIYTGLNNNGILSKVKIRPIAGRNRYKILKSRNTNNSSFTDIKAIKLTSFNIENLLLLKELDADSIIIDKPNSSILQYPNMPISSKKGAVTKERFKFSVNHLITNNGSVKLRKYKNGIKQVTELNGIYFKSSSITESLVNSKLPADYRLIVANGNTELKEIGHTVSFTNLSLNETQTLFIDNLQIKPDSSTLPYHHIDAKLGNVLVKGIDFEALENQSLVLDTVSIGSLKTDTDFTRQKFSTAESSKKITLKDIRIADFSIKNSTINLQQGNSIIYAKDASVNLNNIEIDSIQQDSKPTFIFNNTLLNLSEFSVNNTKNKIKVLGADGYYSEADSTVIINGFKVFSTSDNTAFNLDQISINGFNTEKLKVEKELKFRTLKLIKPIFNLVVSSNGDSSKHAINMNQLVLNGALNKLQFDTLQIVDGKSSISLSATKELQISSIKGIATNYIIDTLSTIYSATNQFKGVFELSDIYLKGLNDTLKITKLHLDTKHKFIWTDSIKLKNYAPTHYLQVKSPGIAIDHLNIPKLLESKIVIGRISTRNNYIILNQLDSTKASSNKNKPAFKLPIDIKIDNLNIINTTFRYNKLDQTNHLLANLNFDIELDSLETKKGNLFDIASQTKDARIRAYDFSFNLQDSLNTIAFDTLLVSSAKSTLDIVNFDLKARYPKYKYGNQVGYQVDWKDLHIEKIKFENIDFVELIEKKTLKCQKITLEEGYLDLFKDKQLPFPSNRVLPVIQERIKNVTTPIKIDTIKIKSVDIFQTTLQSTGLQEGSISFINTNGLITNITNDSVRLHNNAILKVVADTKIMGSGDLYAEFDFDMLNEDNLFYFNARLGAMDAKAFNGILEATAHVSVKSGDVKSINLQATANKSYAHGNMSFIYNNLKVETVNKETLDKKGMGNALKSFFANAFVVKKNNSRLKLIGRRGEMYYERDVSRITIDYAAKTAVSGVVSSIGAKNNRKEIKQINKNNKAARDLELKQQKEQNKIAKKKAKKEQ